jgi:DNA-binding protein HU-beta
MNKSDFVNFIAKSYKLKKIDADLHLQRVLGSVESILSSGGSVNIMGFGTWSVVKRAAREGHHPKTGEKIKINAYNQPIFRVGKRLKDVCNPVAAEETKEEVSKPTTKTKKKT